MDCILSISNLSKKYGELEAIKNISFNVKHGEIIGIVGTSGCGKSTLLNIISGLDKQTSGECLFDRSNPKISYMLQNDTLLPWRNVLDNATLGLELRKEKNLDSIGFVKNLLVEYGLEKFLDKKPSHLSGGMRQRVALIRSLAIKPDLLLLDEPFSALDYYTRIKISEDVYNLVKKSNITTILITHDIAEAISLSDRIIVLSHRPCTIKKIYDVNIQECNTILEKRTNEHFNELYESIWRDLDEQI